MRNAHSHGPRYLREIEMQTIILICGQKVTITSVISSSPLAWSLDVWLKDEEGKNAIMSIAYLLPKLV